jgi:hypothetical protein
VRMVKESLWKQLLILEDRLRNLRNSYLERDTNCAQKLMLEDFVRWTKNVKYMELHSTPVKKACTEHLLSLCSPQQQVPFPSD